MNRTQLPANVSIDEAEPIEASHLAIGQLDKRMAEWLEKRETGRPASFFVKMAKGKKKK